MEDPELAPNTLSLAFVEELYARYLKDPSSVSDDWRRYLTRCSRTASCISNAERRHPFIAFAAW